MRSIYLMVFLFIPTTAYPQMHEIDSLQKVLKTQKEDTNKINTLIAIGHEKNNIGENNEARKYADEELVL
jgi:hypothetical protein